MEDFERYLIEIVEPTANDFSKDPSSVRLGFLACVALEHSVDYLAFPGNRANWDGKTHHANRRDIRERFKNESVHFRKASEVANAFKHVKTLSKRSLEADEIHRRPPAMAGQMMAGASMVGDETGAVVADGDNLLIVVTQALQFLQSKVSHQHKNP